MQTIVCLEPFDRRKKQRSVQVQKFKPTLEVLEMVYKVDGKQSCPA